MQIAPRCFPFHTPFQKRLNSVELNKGTGMGSRSASGYMTLPEGFLSFLIYVSEHTVESLLNTVLPCTEGFLQPTEISCKFRVSSGRARRWPANSGAELHPAGVLCSWDTSDSPLAHLPGPVSINCISSTSRFFFRRVENKAYERKHSPYINILKHQPQNQLCRGRSLN